jgi:hypothetical protein
MLKWLRRKFVVQVERIALWYANLRERVYAESFGCYSRPRDCASYETVGLQEAIDDIPTQLTASE